MSKSSLQQGPGKGIISSGRRILTILANMVETRVRLVVVELEEEKANLMRMLLMIGLAILFTAFGLMNLMVLIIWVIDPQYRLMAITITTSILFFLAILFGLLCLRQSRKSTFLQHTRKELRVDRKLLKDDR